MMEADVSLNSKVVSWRRNAASVLNFRDTPQRFGGYFKEAIAVSCLSSRCYTKAVAVMKKFRQMGFQVNQGLFYGLPGMKDEQFLLELLTHFENGDIGKEEFNRTLVKKKNSVQ